MKHQKHPPGNIRDLFETRLPFIGELAIACSNVAQFKEKLAANLLTDERIIDQDAKENLFRLMEYDGRTVWELSEEREVEISTIELLWQSFRDGAREIGVADDFLWDMYHQFERLYAGESDKPAKQEVFRWMERWPSGLDKQVSEIRRTNRERIVDCLIAKIEHRHAHRSPYVFPEGFSLGQKRRQVEVWWDDYRFHLSLAIRSPRELNFFLGGKLSAEVLDLYRRAVNKGMPVFVTPYYLSLLNVDDNRGYNDAAIRSYVMYSPELVDAFGHIKAWEREDRVRAGEPNAAGWLLPEGHNIHRRYPDVVVLIPDSMGRACGGLCASCQRMYGFQKGNLNFELDELRLKETWQTKLHRLMRYMEEDKQIRDILITGGDALMSQDASLRVIFGALCNMAMRKRKRNEKRPDGQKYAELQRVRIGTRLPAYLPMRVTEALTRLLDEFRRKASVVGVRQFYVQTHFQTPLEVTPEAKKAIRRLQSAGWIVTNQLVYNVAASRRGHTAKLRRILNSLDVLCYYTFSVKGFAENHAVFAPNSRSLQEQQEEKVWGKVDRAAQRELIRTLFAVGGSQGVISRFCRTHRVPFLASDRNVLNLPGIGKSMTFRLVGIMADGRRLLEFDHDHTRKHSPVIKRFPKVYICENKSVGEYLRQLAQMGENCSEYRSIWQYTEGETEPRFPLYEYPETGLRTTDEYNHIRSEPILSKDEA